MCPTDVITSHSPRALRVSMCTNPLLRTAPTLVQAQVSEAGQLNLLEAYKFSGIQVGSDDAPTPNTSTKQQQQQQQQRLPLHKLPIRHQPQLTQAPHHFTQPGGIQCSTMRPNLRSEQRTHWTLPQYKAAAAAAAPTSAGAPDQAPAAAHTGPASPHTAPGHSANEVEDEAPILDLQNHTTKQQQQQHLPLQELPIRHQPQLTQPPHHLTQPRGIQRGSLHQRL
jgi:hypothetical protein